MVAVCAYIWRRAWNSNKVDVHKSYNVPHVPSQLFWAHRARFTTMVQNTLHSRRGSIGCELSKELPSRAVPIRNYLAILTQLGACTSLHIALPPRPAGGPNLIDSESSDDGVLLSARKEQVGYALHTRHYIAPHRYHKKNPLGGHGAHVIPPCYHRGHTVLLKPATANRNVPILRLQPSDS